MGHIHTIAILAINDEAKPVQEYLAKGYYLHKILAKPDRADFSVVILNIDRESIMNLSRMFVPTHIIYGGNNDDIINLIGKYGLEEWIERFESHLSERFEPKRRYRLLRESINAAPFRRYMCRGLLYGSIKV